MRVRAIANVSIGDKSFDEGQEYDITDLQYRQHEGQFIPVKGGKSIDAAKVEDKQIKNDDKKIDDKKADKE